MLESLWRSGWSNHDGLGALIISPTRELALQTFTVINNVGKHHEFSCALLIGGIDVFRLFSHFNSYPLFSD